MAEPDSGAFFSQRQVLAGEASDAKRLRPAIRILAGGDRLEEHRRVFGSMPIDYKVLPRDTDGLLILEHTDPHRGGPPRHLHHEQEEFFYILSGEYLMEVGDEKYRLGHGDSVLAPRGVPHVWASVGEGTGRLLIAFHPAGKMEAFFSEVTKLKEVPPREELARLFREHGMELTGPPLPVG